MNTMPDTCGELSKSCMSREREKRVSREEAGWEKEKNMWIDGDMDE